MTNGYTAHQWVNIWDRSDPDVLWNISFSIVGEKNPAMAAYNFKVFVNAVATKRFSAIPANHKQYQLGFSISDTMRVFAQDIVAIIYWHIKQSIKELEHNFNVDTNNSASFDTNGLAKELAIAVINDIGGARIPFASPEPRLPEPIPELERMIDNA